MGTSTQGVRYDKSWALESGHNRDCRLGRIRIRFFGDSLAIVYGNESNVASSLAGKETRHCVVWTDTWLKRSGKWQIVASQDNLTTCH